MAIKKTLGGDRIGSGNQMDVALHNYERSTHDLSSMWRSSTSIGTLVPFMSLIGLPGDTFDIDLDCEVLTLPTEGPLFGSAKVQLDVYVCPMRLYIGSLHNNKLGIGMSMQNVKLPQIRTAVLSSDIVPSIRKINPSSLIKYLGINGDSIEDGLGSVRTRDFNALPILSYYDIFKNYYSNKQEENCYYIGVGSQVSLPTEKSINIQPNVIEDPLEVILGREQTIRFDGLRNGRATTTLTEAAYPTEGLSFKYNNEILPLSRMFKYINYNPISFVLEIGDVTDEFVWKTVDIILDWTQNFHNEEPRLKKMPLANFDYMREKLLKNLDNDPFIIESTEVKPYGELLNSISADGKERYGSYYSQQGLMVKTYQSDLFNNWLNTDWITGAGGVSDISAIQVVEGKVKVDQIILARKVYDILNRIAVSGGTYDDWLDAVYTHERYTRVESPIYMGGLSKELVFQEIISNSQATTQSGNQPLGTLAGRGKLTSKHKGGKVVIKVDEPSYIIGIFSITPRISYSQGNTFDVNLKSMDDLHKPGLSQIGFQDLITELMVSASTTVDVDNKVIFKSIGKQPAWMNYMTDVDRNYGNFASGESDNFMVFDRNYSYTGEELQWDFTTYIDPAKYNGVFADGRLDAQNYWVQIKKDITARRKMSAKLLPNL